MAKKNTTKKKFMEDSPIMSEYEQDLLFGAWRYYIGRQTILAHAMGGDIGKYSYGRFPNNDRQLFAAYDINREVEQQLAFGHPSFYFPCTSLNRIHVTAIDVYCEFIRDFNIKKAADLAQYKDIRIEYDYSKPAGYKVNAETWDEYYEREINSLKGKYNQFSDEYQAEVDKLDEYIKRWKPNLDHYYLFDFEKLFIWNHLIHLFDTEHHYKAKLIDGSECEYFWSWMEVYGTGDDVRYEKRRIPIDAFMANSTVIAYIPDESILEDNI